VTISCICLLFPGRQFNGAALRRKIDSVIQQIAQRLFEQIGIAFNMKRSADRSA
jgi:hypothetical protein